MRRFVFVLLMLALAGVATACSSASPKSPPSSSSPTVVPKSATPKPSPSRSPFEADPAVKILRLWAIQYGRTINAGGYDSAGLDALMTPSLKANVKVMTRGEVGRHYPGPLPFTPISVTSPNSLARNVRLCAVAGGFSTDKHGRTKKSVRPFLAEVVRVHGRWLLNHFYNETFSCRGVRVVEQKW